MNEEKRKVTAAILTLSESIEGLYSIIRKDLQFRVEMEQSKIVEDFLPNRMRPTSERFKQFEQLLEELDNSEITPLTEEELNSEDDSMVAHDGYYPHPSNKIKRDEKTPPEEYGFSEEK